MIKYKKIIQSLFFLSCLLLMISSVSATDYYVNNDTTHKNISEWIKNDAKTGDSLIFNTSKYELTDTLNISKSINIKSYKNTVINLNNISHMFNISTNGKVVLSDLTLNHNSSSLSDVSVYGTTISGNYLDIKNTIINTNFNRGSSVCISKGDIINCTIYSESFGIGEGIWKGNLINTTINSKSCGIAIYQWKGNLVNSLINAEAGISVASYFHEYYLTHWYGDMLNSTIISKGNGVNVKEWKGKITNSTIYTDGLKSNGINIKYSKGLINRSSIISVDGYAVKVSNDVKILNSSLSSKKGLLKIHRYLADLRISEVILNKKTYWIFISNTGYSISKPTQISLKVGKILKKVSIKSIKPHIPYSVTKGETRVKLTLPKKYLSKKYLKTLKVDYYNKNKEINKKNNIIKFRVDYKRTHLFYDSFFGGFT